MSIRNIAQKVQDWRRERASIRELSRLTDRELADLGIRRGDIDSSRRPASALKASRASVTPPGL